MPMAECRVLLLGLMGSGKTTIGQLLAGRTGWPYHDNDELVSLAYGKNARELLASAGEAALRQAEAEALEAAVELPAPCVAGVAAGTVLDAGNRRLLREGGTVVWLTADPAVLAHRAVGSEHRPWLEEEAEAWLREVARERAPFYAEVASLTVNSDDLEPDEVIEIILAHLSDMARCANWLPAGARRETAGEDGLTDP
jgi:shikimate kinase